LRLHELNLSGNTCWEIWELGKILPSLVYLSDKVNILLSGMVPLIQTHTKILLMDITSTYHMKKQPEVPLKGCILLIVLKEAYIPQENMSHCSNRERVKIHLPLPHLPFLYNIVHVHPLVLLMLLLSPLMYLHD
jgi:hypothetical protein